MHDFRNVSTNVLFFQVSVCEMVQGEIDTIFSVSKKTLNALQIST